MKPPAVYLVMSAVHQIQQELFPFDIVCPITCVVQLIRCRSFAVLSIPALVSMLSLCVLMLSSTGLGNPVFLLAIYGFGISDRLNA